MSTREPGSDDASEPFGTPVSDLFAIEVDVPKWLIAGYVLEHSINILAGPPNSGKTLLAFDWCAKAVSSGKQVFIAQNEGGLRGLQDRLRRACAASNIDKPPPSFTFRRNLNVTLADLGQIRHMAAQLEMVDLIVLDSLASFWPGLNENDPEHMSVVAEALKILCEGTGAAIVGIHHTTKAAWKPGEKPSLGDIRGHGSMAGRVDAAFICKPMERVAGSVRFELHVVKQRDEDWTPPQAVDVLMTGPSAAVSTEPLGAVVANSYGHRDREIEQAVLFGLPDNEPEALSQNKVCEKVRKGKQDVINAIKRLRSKAMIEQTWDGRYYRVKGQAAQRPPSDPRNGRSYWRSVYQTGGADD